MITITQEDLILALQQSAAPQTARLKIEVLDSDKKIIGSIYGAVSGTMSINAQSDIRRTCNFTVQPTLTERIKLTENSLLWLNKDIRLSIGLYHLASKQFYYYPLGYFIYTDTAGTYDKAANQLTINCADFMKKLDGTKNGQLGALVTKFPSYEEDPETGEVLNYFTIRNAVLTVLEQLCRISDHAVDELGEYKGMPEYNDAWETYRKENITWNALPADQEFSCGCSILSILIAFRDLYPNYEMFFEPENNTFICQTIPGCYEDDILLDNTYLQRVLISENTTVDMSAVKNICEVWGKVIETDFYAETSSYSNPIYSCQIQGFENAYANGDIVAVTVHASNHNGACLNINQLGSIPIYDESTDAPLPADRLKPSQVYAFRIHKQRVDGETILRAYMLGQWQVHGINVLTDGRKSSVTVWLEDKEYILYSKEYFQKKYNCESVSMTVIANSPFTVQKLGELLDVKTGGEYEAITSDNLALDRARWDNWKNSRLTDNITITTTLLPFMDVNQKISYQPSDAASPRQYIVLSVSHDFSGFTTTMTLCRFYPLYETLLKEAGTHKVLSQYSHGVLSKYTHEQLTTVVSEEEL